MVELNAAKMKFSLGIAAIMPESVSRNNFVFIQVSYHISQSVCRVLKRNPDI
jgi:hypothetical protein